MGALTKIGLKFNGERFGLPPGSNLWDDFGPRAGFDFECWSYDRDIVLAWFGGDHARDIVAKGEQQAVELMVERLVAILGADARKAFVAGRMHAWSLDPRSLGCYSHALPGQANAREKLARPVADKLYFAGEATAKGPDGDFGPAMTAGGALLAGQAAARDIAACAHSDSRCKVGVRGAAR